MREICDGNVCTRFGGVGGARGEIASRSSETPLAYRTKLIICLSRIVARKRREVSVADERLIDLDWRDSTRAKVKKKKKEKADYSSIVISRAPFRV